MQRGTADPFSRSPLPNLSKLDLYEAFRQADCVPGCRLSGGEPGKGSEGFLYLAAIKDMATREIVGWSMADHLRAELCIGALVMAIQRHRPRPGLVHHGDRGVQYASEPYRAVLERHGITQSMSRRGNCLDNAPMESFFASLKTEHVHQVRYRTREEARTAVFEYIEVFYNRQRLHSGVGYRTPAEARASMEGIAMRSAA